MTIILHRVAQSEAGTFGVLIESAIPFAVTLELPWRDNHHETSCIPAGTYTVTPFHSPTKGNVFLLHDVPNRLMVEMHRGNTLPDSLGCILVAKEYTMLEGNPGVGMSAVGFDELSKKVSGAASWTLSIVDPHPTPPEEV